MSVVVEFIGLCVFTTQVVTGNVITSNAIKDVPKAPAGAASSAAQIGSLATQRVVAIMPRVPDRVGPRNEVAMEVTHVHSAAAQSLASSAAAHVEQHTAMLAFRKEDLLSISGFPPPIPLGTGYEYVELSNGDAVTFVPDLPNGPVNPTQKLPLAHLGDAPLLPRYQHPYAGAAAVFTIPTGALSACEKDRGRIDTTLTLDTKKRMTIKVGSKKLIVADKALVIAANVPLQLAQTGMESSSLAANHYMVYCAMQGKTGGDCSQPERTSSGTDCGATFRYGKQGEDTEPAQMKSVDWACSNSQWP